VQQLYMPAWAEIGLSDVPVEQKLGLAEPPPPASEPPPEGELFHFNQDLWNQAREAVEQGVEPGRKVPVDSVAVSTGPRRLPPGERPEGAPGIAVDLPYESGLAISGRKLIALKLKETRRKSAKRAQELNVQKIQRDFEMRQELQVRIKGKVGRKITVNVDFDDTKEDKRDISVVYQGDPEELVQEAAFGDITLSLPSTEFVSYNKQLFGVRGRLKYKKAQLMVIGSRTKGVTETKRFNGNTQFERKEIADTAYIRRRYYVLTSDPAHLPLAVGSEQIRLDNRVATDNTPNTVNMTVEDPGFSASTFNGDFDLLKPGQDYTVDYARGIINFRNPTAASAVIAADFTLANGARFSSLGGGGFKLIKTENDLPINPLQENAELGYRRELKTFYAIGRNRIIRDNGRGNFIFRVVDLNRNDTTVLVSSAPDTALRYPDNIEVDFEAGTFNIRPPRQVADPTLYAPTPTHKFTYLLEYRFRLKSYLVKPNIVFESERVSVNGRLLTRDLDYFIDYDSGFLTFFNEDQIDETTQIEVTYEFAPFGGQLGQTLVGGRTEFSLVPDRFFVGSTMLYTFAPKPTSIPDVRSTPSSLMVLEGDARLDSFKVPLVPLTMSLAGEVAQSRENPNLFGKALVDSMEGIKQEEQTIMDLDFWQIAANPAGAGVVRPSSLGIGDEEVGVNSINPNARANDGETQRVLRLDYNLTSEPGSPGEPEQASLVQPLSAAGRDFSKKLFMEVWVQGAGDAGAGMDLLVDAGQFNEDADGDGNLDTEDVNRDGTLNLGEDSGFNFNDPGPDALRGTVDDAQVSIGANNGRIDTEDLDADGTADFVGDNAVRGTPLFRLRTDFNKPGVKMVKPPDFLGGSAIDDPKMDLNFTGWRFITVPLDIAASEETAFQAVKQVRVTLVGATGAPRTGAIRLGKISFVGNRWERAAGAGSTMTVTSINNVDNPEYRPLFGNPAYESLYEEESVERVKEQALDLQFQLPAGSSATTRVVFPTARDFSRHKSLRFFLQSPLGQPLGATFVMELGSEKDFFRYTVPITSQHLDSWVLEGASLVDLNDDGTPDVMEPLQGNAFVTVVGSPTITNIGQIKVGVRNDTGAQIDGRLWVNEIHLTGARLKVGNARRVSGDFTVPGWTTFGAKFREVDRNFQTLTSPITNQDKVEESGYLNFTRLAILPLTFSGSRNETVTPAAIRTGESGLVSVLEEGRVETKQGSGKGELALPYMPRIGFGYDKSITDSNLLRRIDDRDTYTGSANYGFPWRPDLLPTRFATLRPLPESVSVNYRRTNYFLSFYDRKKFEELAASTDTQTRENAIFANVRTIEFTDDWTGRASFAPWDGLSLSPSYGWKTVKEQRRFTEADLAEAGRFEKAKDYDKSLSQSHGLAASWRLLRWLEPRLSYTLSGTETNNLPTVSTPTAFEQKTVDRTGDGEASWTFTARELLPNFEPVGSLNISNSFRIQDGDTYENVAREFKDWRRIEMVQLQRIQRQNGRAMYGLLQPLEVSTSPVVAGPLGAGSRRKQLTVRNTFRSSGNWAPLDWINFKRMFEPLKTLSLTATVTNTDEHTETTDTLRDASTVIWPDLIYSLRDTEKLFGLRRWMQNSQLNLRTNTKKTEVFNVQFTEDESMSTDYRFMLFRRYDFFLSYGETSTLDRDLRTQILNRTGGGNNYSGQVGATFGSWRLTPSAAFSTADTADGAGKKLTDLTTHSYGFKTRFDKSYPQGFRFPFTRKVFGKVNRFTMDTNLTYEHKKSSLNVERDNTDTYALSITGEYEIAQNFRLSFGSAGTMIENREKKDDGLMTYEINSTLVIQF
jgi:hypothetical protein